MITLYVKVDLEVMAIKLGFLHFLKLQNWSLATEYGLISCLENLCRECSQYILSHVYCDRLLGSSGSLN